MVRIRLRLRLETPKKNAAVNAFQWLISAGRLWLARRCRRIISSSNRKKMIRSEERRGGKECLRLCKSRVSAAHYKTRT